MNNNKSRAFSNLETSAFCDQLALILGSGVSAYEGIIIMQEESDSEEERAILNIIRGELEASSALNAALAKASVFPSYMLNMTAIGEESGRLDEIMSKLALHYEREAVLQTSIRNTVTYPAVMTCMLTAVVAVLFTKVLPVFNQVFRQLGTEPDGFSGSLVRAGSVIGVISVVAVVFLIAALVLGLAMSRTEAGRKRLVRTACKLSIIRHLLDKIYECRFADGLAIALSSGLTPDKSLELATSLIDDDIWGEKIEKTRTSMSNGQDLTEALRTNGILTGVHSRIASIGYKTGSLEQSMARIAELAQEEADDRMNNILATLEPTLIIVLAVIVGMVILAVMMPLLGVLSGI